jgi:hypothetical protein
LVLNFKLGFYHIYLNLCLKPGSFRWSASRQRTI